jgi:glycogen phosphorylase
MSTKHVVGPKSGEVVQMPTTPQGVSKLLDQYGVGPIKLVGTEDAFYERHLVFDNVVDLDTADARERFEALARSVRDILSQRLSRRSRHLLR